MQMLKFTNKNTSSNLLLNNKEINKVHELEQYKRNQMQIDCITKVLVEHGDVPKKLIEWLIQSVQENVALEYEAAICQSKKR